MKVTAIIDDAVIKDAMKYSDASSVAETLKIVLNEYVKLQKLQGLTKTIKYEPVRFELSAKEIRILNRER